MANGTKPRKTSQIKILYFEDFLTHLSSVAQKTFLLVFSIQTFQSLKNLMKFSTNVAIIIM